MSLVEMRRRVVLWKTSRCVIGVQERALGAPLVTHEFQETPGVLKPAVLDEHHAHRTPGVANCCAEPARATCAPDPDKLCLTGVPDGRCVSMTEGVSKLYPQWRAGGPAEGPDCGVSQP